jgi:hypothetical protein
MMYPLQPRRFTRLAFNLSVIVCAAVLPAGTSHAQTSWYAGAGFGQADGKLDTVGITTLSGPIVLQSSSDNTPRVFGGVRIAEHFAVEVGFSDLGEARATTDDPNFGPPLNITGYKFETTGIDVTAVGILPLGKYLALFGKLGFVRWSTDFEIRSAGVLLDKGTSDGVDPVIGAGVNVYLGTHFMIQGEFNRFEIDPSDGGVGEYNVFRGGAAVIF